jgi:hypothetical protein
MAASSAQSTFGDPASLDNLKAIDTFADEVRTRLRDAALHGRDRHHTDTRFFGQFVFNATMQGGGLNSTNCIPFPRAKPNN